MKIGILVNQAIRLFILIERWILPQSLHLHMTPLHHPPTLRGQVTTHLKPLQPRQLHTRQQHMDQGVKIAWQWNLVVGGDGMTLIVMLRIQMNSNAQSVKYSDKT